MDNPVRVWLAEYRAGRVEALGDLVRHYRRPLAAFLARMIEKPADVDEVFQEVWLRAIEHFDRLRDDNILSWLFRIAHNLVIDRVRRTRPTVALDADPPDGTGLPLQEKLAAPGLAPDRAVAGRDLGARIRAAVSRLPPDQRAVFLMRMEADLSFKEIARIQKISINTALGRMHYATQKLRADLKEDYATS